MKQAEKKIRVAVTELFETIQGILDFQRPRRGIQERFIGGPPALKGADLPEGYDDLWVPLTDLDETLSRVHIAVEHAKLLMTRRTLRDAAEASLVAHACDFETGWYFDQEVTDLIDAATQNTLKRPYTPYTVDAHRNWRHHHTELIERAKRAAAHELSLGGYVVEEKDGQIVRVTSPGNGHS